MLTAKRLLSSILPRSRSRAFFCALLLSVLPLAAQTKVRLAGVFTDKMMLQRDAKASVWGYADPGEAIALTLTDNHATATAIADADGHWTAAFNGLKPGGPFELTVAGKTDTLVIHDVLVGDIWICSGQSNMEYQLKDADEITAPEDPDFRYLLITKNTSIDPQPEVFRPTSWVSASPTTRAKFTAVGYYFGKRLRKETGIPIGLIHTSWGGTPAELWMPKEALDGIPGFSARNNEFITSMRNIDTDATKFSATFAAWEKQYGPLDPGNKGFALGWANPATDTSAWTTIGLPGDWTKLGVPYGGVIWIRRSITVTPDQVGKDLRLNLDNIPDFDTTYFNGEQIGSGGRDAPYFWGAVRSYVVPGRLVKEGDNTFAIRVVTQSPKTRSFAIANRLSSKIVQTTPPVWIAKVETAFTQMPKVAAAAEPKPPTAQMMYTPTVLYNAMVAPLIPYGIKGVIWYQGEANAGRGYNYRFVFPALITSWRNHWGMGAFPFYFVQLANLGTPLKDPNGPAGWAEVRESQLLTWETTPHTGMAVTIDIGEPGNIHPKDKKDVGDRLALFALVNDYGRKIEDSGPVYNSMTVDGKSIRLKFTHIGAGLVAKGGTPLMQFAIAGADKKFFWADAVINGNDVVVSSKEVASPVAVRYGWQSDPEGLNLANREGLPASPFRTDTWPTATANNWW